MVALAESRESLGLITIPASRSYRDWLAGLARRCRASNAATVDRALEQLAGSVGYPGPPMRTPGRREREADHQ